LFQNKRREKRREERRGRKNEVLGKVTGERKEKGESERARGKRSK